MKKLTIIIGIICLLLMSEKGVSQDNTVLFGINVPLSGAYVRQGEDELREPINWR